MSFLRDFVFKLLRIRPAVERRVVIREPYTFRANVMKNQVLYRGEAAELEQFFRQSAVWDLDRARFWAAAPQGQVRKLHTGIVGTVVDRYSDMVTADLNGFDFGEEADGHPVLDRWNEIAGTAELPGVIAAAVTGALASGDGAFKLSVEEGAEHPAVSFYAADSIDILRRGRQITEIRFYTPFMEGEKEFRLEESYGRGYVRYRLLDENGAETELSRLPETAELKDAAFDGDFMMAVPLVLFDSHRWPGRGKALFDGKTDVIDALDEVVSQWLDAVRMGRVKRYIPQDMVPRDPDTGALIAPNPFDNAYVAVGSSLREGSVEKIEVSQPEIGFEAYQTSYAAFLDLVLQGVMSPCTLGIDLKRVDNAEAQREKEKITLLVRSKIVAALGAALACLAERMLMTDDLMHGEAPGSYAASVRFGEYASPDFGSAVEVVARAREGGFMSVEQAVEELYGDTWTAEEKAAECARIREESEPHRSDAG